MGLFNNRKLIRKSAFEISKSRQETRDAIVWEVLPDQRICKIKIQGSNNFLYARYPQNWESTPAYLKSGNAVRVAHRGGNRNILEIVGHGMNVPTFPTGTTSPVVEGSPNKVLTGFSVLPTVPASMSVSVASGTFRLNGVEYEMDDILPIMGDNYTMEAGSNMYMGVGLLHTITFDAPPAAGYTRVDLIVVGADGVLDVVKGSNFLNTAVDANYPVVPSGHVKVAHVFVFGGKIQTNDEWVVYETYFLLNLKGSTYVSTIEMNQINKEWAQAIPAQIFLYKLENGGSACMGQYNNYPYLYSPIVYADFPGFQRIRWKLLDQYSRQYIPVSNETDEVIFEINNAGGDFYLSNDGRVGNDAIGYHSSSGGVPGYYVQISKWHSPVLSENMVALTIQLDEAGNVINHPVTYCYLKSLGINLPLFSFTSLVGLSPSGGVVTGSNCALAPIGEPLPTE